MVFLLRSIFLAAVAAILAAASAFTTYQVGLGGFFAAMTANPVSQLNVLELSIYLTMSVVWIWTDARSRDINPLPYAALALAGPIGPLVYLIRREREATYAPGHRAEAAQVL